MNDLRNDEHTAEDFDNSAFYIATKDQLNDRLASWCRHLLMPSHADLTALPPAMRRSPFYWMVRPLRLASTRIQRRNPCTITRGDRLR
jgi:hypothetical protein